MAGFAVVRLVHLGILGGEKTRPVGRNKALGVDGQREIRRPVCSKNPLQEPLNHMENLTGFFEKLKPNGSSLKSLLHFY